MTRLTRTYIQFLLFFILNIICCPNGNCTGQSSQIPSNSEDLFKKKYVDLENLMTDLLHSIQEKCLEEIVLSPKKIVVEDEYYEENTEVYSDLSELPAMDQIEAPLLCNSGKVEIFEEETSAGSIEFVEVLEEKETLTCGFKHSLNDDLSGFTYNKIKKFIERKICFEFLSDWGNRSFIKKLGVYWFFDRDSRDKKYYFLNFNGVVFSDETGGLSVGGGVRSLWNGCTLGFNMYFDFRLEPQFLSELGLGVEIISPNYSLYGNFYLPIGQRSFKNKKKMFGDYLGGYWVECCYKKARAKVFDLELAKCLCENTILSYWIFTGVYGLDYTGCKEYSGYFGGFRLNALNCVFLEPSISFDKLIKTNFRGRITIMLPLAGNPKGRSPVNRRSGNLYKNHFSFRSNY